MPIFSTLRARLLALVFLAVVPALALMIYGAAEQRRLSEMEVKASAAQLARLVSFDYEQAIDSTRQLLTVLARVPEIRGRSSRCARLLRDLRQLHPRYANFGVADLGGNVWCSAVRSSTPVSMADRDFFRAALATRSLAVGDYQTGRITGKPVVAFALPVAAIHGHEPNGVVFAALDLGWFNQTARNAQLPAGAHLHVMDRKGTVLVQYPRADQVVGQVGRGSAFLRDLRARPAHTAEVAGPDGQQRLYAVTALRSVPGVDDGYVSVGIPRDVAFADADRILARNVTLLAVAALLAMAAAWWGGDAFVLRPARALCAASRRLAVGDFGARTGLVRQRGELGELARSFDEMACALQRDQRVREKQQARIVHLNRLYSLSNAVNRIVVQKSDEQTLFEEVCRVTVEHGMFRLAWVGLLDEATQSVRPMASHGAGTDYVDNIVISARDVPEGRGPTGLAIREKRPVMCHDIKHDPCMAPWREQAAARGYRSCAAFPLLRDLRVEGALVVYSADPDFFKDQEIVTLLRQLVEDLQFARESLEQKRRRYAAEARVDYLAYYDALTGLPNRMLLLDRLAQSLIEGGRRRRPVAVMFLNLDRFKVVNDSLGHDVGDRLLQAVATRLNRTVREGDTVARVGGDEYATVLSDMEVPGDAGLLAQKLVDGFAQPFEIGEHRLFLTPSVGISVFPMDGSDAMTMLKHAGVAMGRAKEQGGNAYAFYRPEMTVKASKRMSLEHELRYAVERGELLLHYQPQFSVASELAGMEALLRWQHRTLGLVPPAEFIPLAEETGLIIPVGEWVLRAACMQNRAWQAAGGRPLRVAVNLSARQFQQKNLAQTVARVLQEAGLEACWLELEITESALMHNVEEATQTLRALDEMGVGLSIDDFGTGYSSLSYLKRFPIDTLKIDQSFVHDVTDDPDDAAIASAIIAMAHSLDMRVVAEGVETSAQLHFLRERACDLVQGYYFSRPLPGDEFARHYFSLP